VDTWWRKFGRMWSNCR